MIMYHPEGFRAAVLNSSLFRHNDIRTFILIWNVFIWSPQVKIYMSLQHDTVDNPLYGRLSVCVINFGCFPRVHLYLVFVSCKVLVFKTLGVQFQNIKRWWNVASRGWRPPWEHPAHPEPTVRWGPACNRGKKGSAEESILRLYLNSNQPLFPCWYRWEAVWLPTPPALLAKPLPMKNPFGRR